MTKINLIHFRSGEADSWVRKEDPCDGFSVKSAYMLITGLQQANHVPAFNTIWHISAPSNVKAFVWRVLWGWIQTRVNLSRRGLAFVGDDLKCSMCQLEDESVDHLLFRCVHASTLWYKCYKWIGLVTVLLVNAVHTCFNMLVDFGIKNRGMLGGLSGVQ